MPATNFGEVAEKLRRSTVLIHSGRRGAGSGVIWSADGLIVTNAHVVRASKLNVQLWDGRSFPAQVSSRDPRADLAQLRIEASGLPAATAADSDRVRTGDTAIAVGNPLGFVGALATGTVHAVAPIPQLGTHPWVQARVQLAPGNSGGPLADARGEIIGINTMMAGGLALAIPSNTVRDFVSHGPLHAWLGVTLHPVALPRAAQRAGAFALLVLEIEPGSPAESASLLPGDILLGADEHPFTSLQDFSQKLAGRGPRLLRLDFLRGDHNRVRRVAVQLGQSNSPRGVIAA